MDSMDIKWKQVVTAPMDWFLYEVLNEKQRKAIGDFFSPTHKEKLVRMLNGKRNQKRKELKQIKYHLYNLGFIEKALYDLQHLYEATNDPIIKSQSALELVLWFLNQETEQGAKQALGYFQDLASEKNVDKQRKIAILQAECFDKLNRQAEAKTVLSDMVRAHEHPDLYLALANLEPTVEQRLVWINKAMSYYQLDPIMIERNSLGKFHYDGLKTLSEEEYSISNGPKVTVVLPAFKAENGIQIAIESILTQTWKNLELIIVDDCSPDDTAKVVQSYMKKDSRIQLLHTPKNSGPYVARNIGLQAATGEFITINDSDDWSHKQKIETQVTHLMENKQIIANTSEHARLTEDLRIYRRGTPGKYIFPNMSSIMFRRNPVLEKIGYWDSVRFAADGEFKRRLIKVFGKQSYVDLNSGPLSLPRQTATSLTGSSAFGYNGFFMGARREYVNSLEYYHKRSSSLYYDYPLTKRPFPVPEPMWPDREAVNGERHFDVVIVSDFRLNNAILLDEFQYWNKQQKKIGIVQRHYYDLSSFQQDIDHSIRDYLDGTQVQMIVYGETVTANLCIVVDPIVLAEHQRYVPKIKAEVTDVIMSNLSKAERKTDLFVKGVEQVIKTFDNPIHWYVETEDMKQWLSLHYPIIADKVAISKRKVRAKP